MSKDCSYCDSSPRGIEGHGALFIVDIRPTPNYKTGTPIFRCSACGSQWMREYAGGGTFNWRLLQQPASTIRETRPS